MVVQHGSFVNQQDIHRQRMPFVIGRLHQRRFQPQQAVHRLPFDALQMFGNMVRQPFQPPHGILQRLRQTRARLARGRHQGNARQAAVRTQQRQQLGNSGGFARARPAAYQHERLQQRQRAGCLLVKTALIGKPLLQFVRHGGRLGHGAGCLHDAADVPRQFLLLPEIFRQKQLPAAQHQRRIAVPADQIGHGV